MLTVSRPMHRREWLAAAGVAAFAGCAHTKGTGFFGYGLVASSGDNSLTAIDLTNFRLSSVLELKSAPSRVIATPENHACVLTPKNGTVQVVGPDLKLTTARTLADELSDIALLANQNALMALAPDSRALFALNPQTLAPLRQYKLKLNAPLAGDYSTNGYAAFSNKSGAIELIDLKSGMQRQEQFPSVGAMRFRADGKILLAADRRGRSLLALDVPSLEIVAELPLAMEPEHLCFNSDQGQLFVSGAGMDAVAVVFPYKVLEVDQTLLAGRDPGAMACSASPSYLFVGSNSGSDVCVLDIDTRKIVGVIETGGRPTFIGVTPDSQYALVLDEGSGALGVIHITPIHRNRLKTGVALFTMLSVGSKPVDLAIIRREA